jgi:transcriptional regulator with XRE-family HTH domain
MSFDRKTHGSRLRDARLERGLTQAQVGQLVGMRQSRVSAYESGTYLMSLDVLTDYIAKCDLHPGTVFPEWYARARQIDGARARSREFHKV